MTANTKVLTSKDVAIAAKAGKVLRTATRSFDTSENGEVTVTEGQRRNTLAEKRGLVVYLNKKEKVAHLTTTYDMAVMPFAAMLTRSFRDLKKQKTIAIVCGGEAGKIEDFTALRTSLDYSVTDAQGAKGWLFDQLTAAGFNVVGKRTSGAVTIPHAKKMPAALLAEAVAMWGEPVAELPESQPEAAKDANEAELQGA
jgi:hypothetical protein